MNPTEMLKTHYQFFYVTAKQNVDGVSAEASVRQPEPDGNCANWILGHITRVHNGIMQLVGEDPVWDDASLDRAADAPITSPDQAIDWDTMVTRLAESEQRFMGGLDALTPEQLDEGGFTDPFGNDTTRGDLLNLLAFHQTYHAGQLGLSRRLVGLPGAFRAPEPQAAEA